MRYNMHMRTIKFSFMVLCASLLLSNILTASAAAQCVSFQSDLSYGMSDSSANGTVMLLQQYLSGAGYLAVSPTGYFGLATLAAVQGFQSANGIQNTGYVGPLTRAALGRITCVSIVSNVQTVQPIQAQTTPIAVAPAVPTVPVSTITAPQNGQTLTMGQTFDITWNPQPYARYDIVLVSTNGPAGFIAQSIVGIDQYLWTVGNVFSSRTQSNQTVQPGSYQIRIQNSTTGAEPTDPISAPFTLAAATLTLSSVFPASASADGVTAIVLYGSDFNSSVSVNLGGSGAKGQILFTSSDGKVLVFSIPLSTPAGYQSVSVTNSAGQSSNQLSFTIISP